MNKPINSNSILRTQAARKIINLFDPVYWFLDRIIFKNLFVPRTIQSDGTIKKEHMEESETTFLLANLQKHRLILWLNLLTLFTLSYHGYDSLIGNNENADPALLVSGLLAPAMITGAAWFAISFGGISEKFLDYAARYLTFALFSAFTLSLTLLSFLLISISPWQIGVIIVVVYAGIYYPCVLYDNLDGLKVGLDTTMLKFSRASLNYYQKHGLITRRETQTEQYEDNLREDQIGFSDAIIRINLSINQMRAILEKFEANQSLVVANEFIASIVRQIFATLGLELSKDEIEFVKEGYALPQEQFDKVALAMLSKSCKRLRDSELGKTASQEIASIEQRIIKLEKFNPKQIEMSKQETQAFADSNFSQILNALVELLAAYKHLIARELSKQKSEQK